MPQDAKRSIQALDVSRFCQHSRRSTHHPSLPPTGHRPGPSTAPPVGAEPPHHLPYEHEKTRRGVKPRRFPILSTFKTRRPYHERKINAILPPHDLDRPSYH